MISFKIHFDKYDWCIETHLNVCPSDANEIAERLENMRCSRSIIEQAVERLTEYENSGFTYSNPEYHKSIVVVGQCDSAKELVNTYNHEKNHVEMKICEEYGIDPYSEQAAYLSGELSKLLFIEIVNNVLD